MIVAFVLVIVTNAALVGMDVSANSGFPIYSVNAQTAELVLLSGPFPEFASLVTRPMLSASDKKSLYHVLTLNASEDSVAISSFDIKKKTAAMEWVPLESAEKDFGFGEFLAVDTTVTDFKVLAMGKQCTKNMHILWACWLNQGGQRKMVESFPGFSDTGSSVSGFDSKLRIMYVIVKSLTNNTKVLVGIDIAKEGVSVALPLAHDLQNLQYNPVTGVFFGLANTKSSVSLVKVDPIAKVQAVVRSYPDYDRVSSPASATCPRENVIYSLVHRRGESKDVNELATISLSDGTLVQSPRCAVKGSGVKYPLCLDSLEHMELH